MLSGMVNCWSLMGTENCFREGFVNGAIRKEDLLLDAVQIAK
jgi:hypothetical protein